MSIATAAEHELGSEQAELSLLRLASRFQTLSLLQPAAVHDFRGSLNTLSLNVRLLEQISASGSTNGPDGDLQRRCVASLREELSRLERLTCGVLEEGRADTAQSEIFSLARVIEEALTLLRPTAARQQVTISFEPPARDLTTKGRSQWIRHAILNLADNALQAMPDGGSIRLELRHEDDRAVIEVADSGPGIPDDVRERMWDVNYSTRRGLGIGLPVVAHIVKAHKGSVVLEPSSTGASFAIRLPVAR
jgi:signal transduction histidine kinase